MDRITPGVWYIENQETDEQEFIRVIDEQDVTVCKVYKQPYDPPEWAHNNAKLIAAAPDLLEAPQSMLNIAGAASAAAHFLGACKGLDVESPTHKARLAIAKALGED